MQVDTHVACRCLCSYGSEYDVKDLPSVLHLNAVTVRAPPTFFSTTSQSPSTACLNKWHNAQSRHSLFLSFFILKFLIIFTFAWIPVAQTWELLCTYGMQSHRQYFGSDCAVGDRGRVQDMTVCFQQFNFQEICVVSIELRRGQKMHYSHFF